MASFNGYKIELLSETNYESWKMKMKSVLVMNNLWGYVTATIPQNQANAAQWDENDLKALSCIFLGLSSNKILSIRNAKTSKEAWDLIKEEHESTGPLRQTLLYRKLHDMKKDHTQSMETYLNEFLGISEQLKETSVAIPDNLLVIMLLGSLPSEYSIFCTAMESRDKLPSMKEVKSKLLEQEAKLKKNEETSSDSSAYLSQGKFVNNYKGKFKGRCRQCHKYGHRQSDCPDAKRESEPQNQETKPIDLLIVEALHVRTKEDSWILDSGATRHISCQKTDFINLSPESMTVYTASNRAFPSAGTGDIQLNARVDGTVNPIRLSSAIYVPGFSRNLISVSCIVNKGYTARFKKDRADILRPDGSKALTAWKRDGLYHVDLSSSAVQTNFTQVKSEFSNFTASSNLKVNVSRDGLPNARGSLQTLRTNRTKPPSGKKQGDPCGFNASSVSVESDVSQKSRHQASQSALEYVKIPLNMEVSPLPVEANALNEDLEIDPGDDLPEQNGDDLLGNKNLNEDDENLNSTVIHVDEPPDLSTVGEGSHDSTNQDGEKDDRTENAENQENQNSNDGTENPRAGEATGVQKGHENESQNKLKPGRPKKDRNDHNYSEGTGKVEPVRKSERIMEKWKACSQGHDKQEEKSCMSTDVDLANEIGLEYLRDIFSDGK